jgi:hypothetical protein
MSEPLSLEDIDHEVYECWNVLSFDWATMPEAQRQQAVASAREGLWKLTIRLRAALAAEANEHAPK